MERAGQSLPRRHGAGSAIRKHGDRSLDAGASSVWHLLEGALVERRQAHSRNALRMRRLVRQETHYEGTRCRSRAFGHLAQGYRQVRIGSDLQA
jgi:hypothetical protein